MFEVKSITLRQIWENFVISQPYTLFVQSWSYGEFYRLLGEEFWVFGVYDGDSLIGGALVVSTHAKRGNFLYIPYGPIIVPDHPGAFDALVGHIRSFAKEKGYCFIRVSPFMEDTSEIQKIFRDAAFKPAPMHILAETTWILDIKKDEDALLKEMNKNHRNLIRRCLKEGVRIEIHTDSKKLEPFHELLDTTVHRHKFHRFSRSYVEKEFSAFAKDNQAAILQAFLPDGTLDASAIIMFYGTMAAYRHGASRGASKIPSSYLLQWEAIREAKKRGMRYYNFWGIAPDGATKKHPFYGISHFKKGFGGRQLNLLHCQDLPLSGKYAISWAIESIRRVKRGF